MTVEYYMNWKCAKPNNKVNIKYLINVLCLKYWNE